MLDAGALDAEVNKASLTDATDTRRKALRKGDPWDRSFFYLYHLVPPSVTDFARSAVGNAFQKRHFQKRYLWSPTMSSRIPARGHRAGRGRIAAFRGVPLASHRSGESDVSPDGCAITSPSACQTVARRDSLRRWKDPTEGLAIAPLYVS